MASTMQALVKSEPEKSYRLTQVPVPKAGPGQVTIKMERVSICGSDIPLYKWDAVRKIIFPLTDVSANITLGRKRSRFCSLFLSLQS
jgi:D-arabinose 1-dehydrogenase-like Zn-dependent alcohol dehydrogenase